MSQAMYRSIHVPLDGSPFAEQTLPLAAELARRSGAILQIGLVHRPVPALATAIEVPDIETQLDQEARAREQIYLTSITERVRRMANVPVTGTLLDGPVAEALQHQVESSGADLVVITTHGRGPMSRFWLGSVADHLMRVLHIPVLMIRPTPAGESVTVLHRILVTLDGSPFAERALQAALMLGRPFGAEYALVMVVEPLMPIVDPFGMMPIPVSPDVDAEHLASATRYLEGVAARLRKDKVTVTAHAVQAAGAAATIIAQAEALSADLIAIASHGAGGYKRAMIGSVADKVVRGSNHPTLVVRPAKAD